MDIVDQKKRSAIMRAVRQAGTTPELRLRDLLRASGLLTHVNLRSLRGSPDIVLRQKRVAIFVHGCFWRPPGVCGRATTPMTNRPFWLAKFCANRRRDECAVTDLIEKGWRVLVVWECALL